MAEVRFDVTDKRGNVTSVMGRGIATAATKDGGRRITFNVTERARTSVTVYLTEQQAKALSGAIEVDGRVTHTQIQRQRHLGWPDFHPEDYCHRCGIKNLSWATDARTWNPVMRPAGEVAALWNEIICPQCFAELFEERFGPTTFLLAVDERTIGGRSFVAHIAPRTNP